MGKRKTRKRSRRSKKGGMGGLTAAEHGAASLCVWYGRGNKNNPENQSFLKKAKKFWESIN